MMRIKTMTPTTIYTMMRGVSVMELVWYYITYQCPDCNEFFADVWSTACEGECPHCKTKEIKPTEYEEIDQWV